MVRDASDCCVIVFSYGEILMVYRAETIHWDGDEKPIREMAHELDKSRMGLGYGGGNGRCCHV